MTTVVGSGPHVAVSEGFCPLGHGRLRAKTESGWCATCRAGWSASSDGLSLWQVGRYGDTTHLDRLHDEVSRLVGRAAEQLPLVEVPDA